MSDDLTAKKVEEVLMGAAEAVFDPRTTIITHRSSGGGGSEIFDITITSGINARTALQRFHVKVWEEQ